MVVALRRVVGVAMGRVACNEPGNGGIVRIDPAILQP